MLYAIICYDSEDVVGAWTEEKDAEVMTSLGKVQDKLVAQNRLGPVARLLPTTAATTIMSFAGGIYASVRTVRSLGPR